MGRSNVRSWRCTDKKIPLQELRKHILQCHEKEGFMYDHSETLEELPERVLAVLQVASERTCRPDSYISCMYMDNPL